MFKEEQIQQIVTTRCEPPIPIEVDFIDIKNIINNSFKGKSKVKFINFRVEHSFKVILPGVNNNKYKAQSNK